MTGETIKEAMWGKQDVTVTAERVQSLPYASMYARINGQQRIFMVLAFVDNNPQTGAEQLKWLSADRGMIVTENGRVVKTLNLPSVNLVNTEQFQKPFPTYEYSPYVWQVSYDFMPDYNFNHITKLTTEETQSEFIESLIWSKETVKWRESVEFVDSDQQAESFFWVDEQGQVLKTYQTLKPGELSIELEFLKLYQSQ